MTTRANLPHPPEASSGTTPSVHPLAPASSGEQRELTWPREADVGLEIVPLPDGQLCREGLEVTAHNPLGAPQAYFRVPRARLLPAPSLELTVELVPSRSGDLRVQYDASRDATIDDPRPIAETAGFTVESGIPTTATFTLENPRFARNTNGCDFRLIGPGDAADPMRIRRVRLRGRFAWVPTPAEIEPFPESGDEAEVSIVVPTFNRVDLTLRCLAALRRDLPTSTEVIVVDDGSIDDTSRLVGQIPGIRLVTHATNRGYATACNTGASHARGRWLVLLNNDTEPDPGWLDELLRTARADPSIGIVGSLLLFPDRTIQHCGVDFTPEGMPYHARRSEPANTPDLRETRETEAVTGACMLTDANLFASLSGLDTGYRNGFEDIDYCLRARRAGRRVFTCGRSVLLHHESATIEPNPAIHEANERRFRATWSAGRPFGDQPPPSAA